MLPTDVSSAPNTPISPSQSLRAVNQPTRDTFSGGSFASFVTNTTWMESKVLPVLNSLLWQISHITVFYSNLAIPPHLPQGPWWLSSPEAGLLGQSLAPGRCTGMQVGRCAGAERAGQGAPQAWQGCPGLQRPGKGCCGGEPTSGRRLPLAGDSGEEIPASRRCQSKIRKTKPMSDLHGPVKQEPRLCTHVSKLAHDPRFAWLAATTFPKECAVEHQLQEALCRTGVSLPNRFEKYHMLRFPLLESRWPIDGMDTSKAMRSSTARTFILLNALLQKLNLGQILL